MVHRITEWTKNQEDFTKKDTPIDNVTTGTSPLIVISEGKMVERDEESDYRTKNLIEMDIMKIDKKFQIQFKVVVGFLDERKHEGPFSLEMNEL